MIIRGHNGTNLTAPFWTDWVLHTDSSSDICELHATVGAIRSENNFSAYVVYVAQWHEPQGTVLAEREHLDVAS